MNMGTVAYNNKIYNLDYMTAEEVIELLNKIEEKKLEKIEQIKSELK